MHVCGVCVDTSIHVHVNVFVIFRCVMPYILTLLVFITALKLLHLSCVCTCVHMHSGACLHICAVAYRRSQRTAFGVSGVGSVLLPCGSWGSNPSLQTWQQVPFLHEPSCLPVTALLYRLNDSSKNLVWTEQGSRARVGGASASVPSSDRCQSHLFMRGS